MRYPKKMHVTLHRFRVLRMFVKVFEERSASCVLPHEERCAASVLSIGLGNHVRHALGQNQCNVQNSYAASTHAQLVVLSPHGCSHAIFDIPCVSLLTLSQ